MRYNDIFLVNIFFWFYTQKKIEHFRRKTTNIRSLYGGFVECTNIRGFPPRNAKFFFPYRILPDTREWDMLRVNMCIYKELCYELW